MRTDVPCLMGPCFPISLGTREVIHSTCNPGAEALPFVRDGSRHADGGFVSAFNTQDEMDNAPRSLPHDNA